MKLSRGYLHKIVQILFEYFCHIFLKCQRYIFNSKKITLQINAPQFMTNIVLYLSYRIMDIWWYPKYPSKNEYTSHPTTVFSTSFVNGNGKGFFFFVAFNFLKSTKILSFPFFFGTSTICDNHVAFSTCCINLVINSLYQCHVSLLQCNLDLTYTWPNVHVVWLYPIQLCVELTLVECPLELCTWHTPKLLYALNYESKGWTTKG
jgi:hypothetical protein